MTHLLSSSDHTTPSTQVQSCARPAVDVERITDLVRRLLSALGEDPHRAGLAQTPSRVATWYADFLSQDVANTATCFEETRVSDQLVVVSGMSLWSLCEHHLLPMHLEVGAAYGPDTKVLGLSKFGRIAQQHAGALQVQERFTRQITESIAQVLDSQDVAVAVRGTHLCMSMRGVRMEAARTTTMDFRGRFKHDTAPAQHVLALITNQWGRT